MIRQWIPDAFRIDRIPGNRLPIFPWGDDGRPAPSPPPAPPLPPLSRRGKPVRTDSFARSSYESAGDAKK